MNDPNALPYFSHIHINILQSSHLLNAIAPLTQKTLNWFEMTSIDGNNSLKWVKIIKRSKTSTIFCNISWSVNFAVTIWFHRYNIAIVRNQMCI